MEISLYLSKNRTISISDISADLNHEINISYAGSFVVICDEFIRNPDQV